MPRILIADGNTPDITARVVADGCPSFADGYADAIHHFATDADIVTTAPYGPDWDLDALGIDGFDGLAVTGSGVDWSGADERARPFWQLYEAAFRADVPAIGCCWGLQTAAVVLGGDTDAGPNGFELAFARDITLTPEGAAHPLHAGRTGPFDALCMHRDDVTRVPDGAVITATNAHTAVQGMVYEAGTTRFWGVQYHPEITLAETAGAFRRRGEFFATLGASPRMAADLQAILDDPEHSTDVQARHGIDGAILNRDRHGMEIRNWVASL